MAEGRLREVEEDAMYIANKRFREQQDENQREAEKQARQNAKANSTSDESDKKGK